MSQNGYFSPIYSLSHNENEDDIESDPDVSWADWSGPENQLGLDPDYISDLEYLPDLQQDDEVQLGLQPEDQAVALDKKG
jgi:hypothetical protein